MNENVSIDTHRGRTSASATRSGATLGAWTSEHGEGWTSDGRTFTDMSAWFAHVREMAR